MAWNLLGGSQEGPHLMQWAMPDSNMSRWTRRRLLQWGSAAVGLTAVRTFAATPAARTEGPLTRPIPSSGEALPLVGLGSWITFNVGRDRAALANCTAVLRAFFAAGGRLVDSSPMYGSSQPAIGQALAQLGQPAALFSAEKVWTSGNGAAQMAESRAHWGVPRFDLMQVHNLLDWQTHLPALFEMKAAGRLRYVGITTSHGRRHAELEQIMHSQPLDFVQLTYNLVDRAVEQRLLPLAQERGIAVIVNRPFQGGRLVDRLHGAPLPGWAAEIGCQHWAQVALKFTTSHPAVTCAIPATSQVAHLQQNMAASRGALPDAALRRRMLQDVQRLL
jgi:diketogulonate reductase-like aldo/keto reductase